MWKYMGESLGLEGITGIPARDMTDEEFAEAEAKLALKFPTQLGALSRSGLWVKEEEEKPRTETRNRFVTRNPIDKADDDTKVEGDSNG